MPTIKEIIELLKLADDCIADYEAEHNSPKGYARYKLNEMTFRLQKENYSITNLKED